MAPSYRDMAAQVGRDMDLSPSELEAVIAACENQAAAQAAYDAELDAIAAEFAEALAAAGFKAA